MEKATLGGGCFWCLDAIYRNVIGVDSVVSGYAGGTAESPSYEQVSSSTTGHAEVVQITFDPQKITYQELLELFFHIHDPTTKDRQGNDVGSQYRSIILYHSEDQRKTAEIVIEQITQEAVYEAPIVTELVPFESFYPAEDYHQNYFAQNPDQPYCQLVINPKVSKFRKNFSSRLKI